MADRSGSLTDMKVLLDFLKQSDSASQQCHDEQAQITSLQALSTMCTKEVAELMVECEGLKLIWRLCGKTKYPEVSQSCLYTLTCAAECSEQVRCILSTNRVFITLRAILEISNVTDKMKTCASYLLIPLVARRAAGQELLRCSGCLQVLLRIFASGVQLITRGKLLESHKSELWTLSAKVLRRAVSAPQNKINQLECIKFIPQMVTILYESKDDKIILHACQVLGAVLEFNSTCQEKAFSSRALEVLILILQSRVLEPSEIEIQGEIAITVHNLLNEQKKYCERFEKLGGIAILLHVLKCNAGSMTVPHASYVLTILARCADYSERSRQNLLKCNAVSIVVRLMNSMGGDKYFNKIAAAVLNYCMQELHGDSVSGKSFDDSIGGETSSSASRWSNNKSFHGGSEIPSFEMLNGGGSCITSTLEKQQTQIDVLRKLITQERHKRIASEQKLAEIKNVHSMSACDYSILSPYPRQYHSSNLPLFGMQQCQSHGCPTPTLSNQQISKATRSATSFHPFYRSLRTSSSRHLKPLQASLTKISSVDCQNVCPSISPCVQVADEESMPVKKPMTDFGCQIKPVSKFHEDAIDVESYTPCKPVKEVILSRSNEKARKYYVTKKRKIRQHVSRNTTSTPRSRPVGTVAKQKLLPGVRHSGFVDDLMSVCSDILYDEIRKEKQARLFRRARENSQRVLESVYDPFSVRRAEVVETSNYCMRKHVAATIFL